MKILDEKTALYLLTNDSIKDHFDFKKPENRWILHSIYVGIAAKRIAKKLNLNDEYLASLGYIHDIGRKINHNNHPIEGYNYLKSLNYLQEAKICLTHSFIDNDIYKTAGGGPKDPMIYQFIESFLLKNPPGIEDSIIQLCDLFCLETGFTTIEKRLLDISKRKGIYQNSYDHFIAAMNLKRELEDKMKTNLYQLFPEIPKEDFKNQEHDKQLLLSLFSKLK